MINDSHKGAAKCPLSSVILADEGRAIIQTIINILLNVCSAKNKREPVLDPVIIN